MEVYFSIILLILALSTGLICLIDRFYLHRYRDADNLPALLSWSKSLFPVFFIVLVLRSFIFEPFRIPSPSMLPTLQTGDLIIVNKFAYGLKAPVWHTPITQNRPAERGDVVVLHYPVNPDLYYIKRIVGIPGDRISYVDKVLTINGEEMSQRFIQKRLQAEGSASKLVSEHMESLSGLQHDILLMPWQADLDFYDLEVPKGQYFVMGDNRDNSQDSRFWGFVPEEALVGKAFIIFFSINLSEWDVHWSRIGKLVH